MTPVLYKSNEDPSTPSEDYLAMKPYWDDVASVLGGIREMRKTTLNGQSPYLPKFEEEFPADYRIRLSQSTITNFFSDTIETLASKPFTSDVTLKGVTKDSRQYRWVKDVDGRGSNLTKFCVDWHYWGIANAIDWVLVDYPMLPAGMNLNEEENINPYFLRIPATDVKEVQSVRVNSHEYVTHFRVERVKRVRDKYEIKKIPQVWVFSREVNYDILSGRPIGIEPATVEILEREEETQVNNINVKKVNWTSKGVFPITIGVIPVVPFITGRRIEGTWNFIPPMDAALTVQIDHFQQQNSLRYAQTMACFPILAGNGVQPQMGADGEPEPFLVGPRSVLYAPPSEDGRIGGWSYIEPDATSLRFLAEQLERTENNGRELGRQPLTAKADNITQITTAYAGSKANTLSQVWAMNFKQSLQLAITYGEMWMGLTPTAEVMLDTDFDNDLLSQSDPETLLTLRERGDLSRITLWSELKRLRLLDEEFDPEAEETLLAAEPPPPSPEQNIPPADGEEDASA